LINFNDFRWESDYNGDEVGHNDVSVVGQYTLIDYPEINVYVDTEKGVIIEIWVSKELIS
jgi:hypothetical protein